MITYVTGLPGSGKTLWTIQEIQRISSKEPDRRVFYFNIPGVLPELKWTPLTKDELTAAHELPLGSIVAIDEAWEIFPQRRAGTAVPSFIEAFATHRHRGHDFYLISQRPGGIDHFIRGLVGRHLHCERVFGFKRARHFEWQKFNSDVEDKQQRKEALRSTFNFPVEVFKLYRSSEEHTEKKRPPWKIFGLIGFLLLLLVACAFFVARIFSSPAEQQPEVKAQAPQQAPVREDVVDFSPEAIQAALVRKLKDNLEWEERFQPRRTQLPLSAPAFDSLTTPKAFPRISGCMRLQLEDQGKDTCSCFTQQSTRIREIDHPTCVAIMADGLFDWTRPDSEFDSKPHQQPTAVTTQPSPTVLGGAQG